MSTDRRELNERTWLDVRGAASRALVSPATILREARVGRLRGYKIGGRKIWRFLPADVDGWVTRTTIPTLVTPDSQRRSA
jgi:hypothetical protein